MRVRPARYRVRRLRQLDDLELSTGSIAFYLWSLSGASAVYDPAFTDTGQFNLDGGGLPTLYVRMPAATDTQCAPGAGGSSGAGVETPNAGASSSATGAVAAGGSKANTPSQRGPGCDVPDGHVVPYKTARELEARIVGDWLQCGPDWSYPSEFGDGIRILADHTWYSLAQNAACGYDPVDTGFEGYGTWVVEQLSPSFTQFDLMNVMGGTGVSHPVFTDTDQLNFEPDAHSPTVYVRMHAAPDAGASCGETGAGP